MAMAAAHAATWRYDVAIFVSLLLLPLASSIPAPSSPPQLRAYSPEGHGGCAKYLPADALLSPRFTGVRTFARLPYLSPKFSKSPKTSDDSHLPEAEVDDLSGVDVAVVGLPFDTGATFKVGARFGPEAIRSASAILRPHNHELGITTLGVLSCVDYGDASVAPGFIEASYERMTSVLEPLAKQGIITLGLGGDHSITLAELRALAAVHGPLALVHFDSHGDVWDSYFGFKYTHGTPFRRAVEEGLLLPERSIQIGMRGPVYGSDDIAAAKELGFQVLTTTELLALTPSELGAIVQRRVGNTRAFLSFDVDFFDPAFAPGTGTPEVGGPSTFQGFAYLRSCTGITWVGGDVVEVLPALDHGQITAHAAAQAGYEFLSLVALEAAAARKGAKTEESKQCPF